MDKQPSRTSEIEGRGEQRQGVRQSGGGEHEGHRIARNLDGREPYCRVVSDAKPCHPQCKSQEFEHGHPHSQEQRQALTGLARCRPARCGRIPVGGLSLASYPPHASRALPWHTCAGDLSGSSRIDRMRRDYLILGLYLKESCMNPARNKAQARRCLRREPVDCRLENTSQVGKLLQGGHSVRDEVSLDVDEAARELGNPLVETGARTAL